MIAFGYRGQGSGVRGQSFALTTDYWLLTTADERSLPWKEAA